MKFKLRLIGVRNRYTLEIKSFKEIQNIHGINSIEELSGLGYRELTDEYREYLVEQGCYIDKNDRYYRKYLSGTEFLFFNNKTMTLTQVEIDTTLPSNSKPKDVMENILSELKKEMGLDLDINIYSFNDMINVADRQGLEVTVDIKNQMSLGSFLAPTSYVVVNTLGKPPFIEVLDESRELNNMFKNKHIVIGNVLNLFDIEVGDIIKIEGQESVIYNTI